MPLSLLFLCAMCPALVAVFSGSWVLVPLSQAGGSPQPLLLCLSQLCGLSLFCVCPGLAFLAHSCHFFLVLCPLWSPLSLGGVCLSQFLCSWLLLSLFFLLYTFRLSSSSYLSFRCLSWELCSVSFYIRSVSLSLPLFMSHMPMAKAVGLSSSFFLSPYPHGPGASRGSRPCFPHHGMGVEAMMPARWHPHHHSPHRIPSDGATCHHGTVSTAPGCLPHR